MAPPPNDARMQKIEDKLSTLSERVAKIEGIVNVPLPPKTTHPILTAVLPLFGAAILAFWAWAGNTLVNQGNTLARIETEILSLQKSQAQNLLHSAEEQAKAGDTAGASSSVLQAADLVQKFSNARTPAPASFFAESVQTLNHLNANGVRHEDINIALMHLAEYRSKLSPSPSLAGGISIESPLTASQFVERLQGKASVIIAAVPDMQFVIGPANVVNVVFVGGAQTLDGLTLKNVTFFGTKISFAGKAPAVLDQVVFINCTFEGAFRPEANPLLEYAALGQTGKLELSPNM